MTELILVLASLVLLAAFLILTRIEEKRGTRLFARARARLDARTEHAVHAIESGQASDAVARGVKLGAERIAHDVAHGSLIAVRFVERTLTQAVRSLRARRAENAAPGASASPFASTMKDFSQELRNGRDSSTETPG